MTAERIPTPDDLRIDRVEQLHKAAVVIAPGDPERQTKLVVYALRCSAGAERLLSVAANIS